MRALTNRAQSMVKPEVRSLQKTNCCLALGKRISSPFHLSRRCDPLQVIFVDFPRHATSRSELLRGQSTLSLLLLEPSILSRKRAPGRARVNEKPKRRLA